MDTLLGRSTECEALDGLLSDVLTGTSRVVVVRGDPGVGKSALLRFVAERTQGWQVTTARGVESEMELAYSGLQQLCAPLLRHLERLPTLQRDALGTVFGLRSGPVPDRFLVGLACLTLIAEAAEDVPLACIVDDTQWLDNASAQVLGFVGRRLLAERVALVCAARTGPGDSVLAGLPELELRGLGDSDARTLLLAHAPGPIDAAVIDRVVAESRGNPLALLELPRTWRRADLAGGFGHLDTHTVAGKVEQSFAQRLGLLPPQTQLVVLAAAAEPLGDPDLLGRAVGHLGAPTAAALPAVDAGLLQVRARVEFAHPLVRSAAYRAATATDRQRVHHALAEATDADTDPDRRAWHRARATVGPDEDVAAELERSAGRAQARGGMAAAAAFLTRAVELTPDPGRRVQRAVDAAAADVAAGAFDAADRLLTIANAGPLTEEQRARIDVVRAQLAFASRRGSQAPALLLAAARRLEPLDATLARETYLDAFSAAQFAARLSTGVSTVDVAEAARRAVDAAGPEPTPADRVLDAFVALTQDYATAVPRGRTALRTLREEGAATGSAMRWLWQGCVLALEIWDDDSAYVLSQRHLDLARRTGALTELPLALGSHTPVLVFCGELSAAAALVDEAHSVYEVAGISEAPYGALTLAAWRGQERETRALVAATLRDAGARGEGVGVAICEYSHAVLCNALGQYDEALLAARRACEDPQEMVAHNWGLPELVEAAVRAGRPEQAEEAVERLTTKGRSSGTAWGLGIAARALALTSAGDDAEGAFQESLVHLERSRVRADLARTHLLHGEWLRSADRRAEARTELETAHAMFTAMGMRGFAGRARAELAAAGASVRSPHDESRGELTAQEAHIARLAGDGLSNADIGAQLFLSGRTVEWHLRKVFTKLGITSRRDLRGRVPAPRERLTSEV
jgi:DNA-binding CsgD family transcriptional regulator/DNA replicative helicase MCM subunit Mcm2 (Cdc46/Mcm family)